jgi:hypothetical protein
MSQYTKSEWKEFRDTVIEMDGYKCVDCGRSKSQVTLQVHHKTYVSGLKIWEHPPEECVTLCKGCHARRHNIIQPAFGWEYIDEEDLGDLIGTCENRGCSKSIRFCFTIFHKDWGTLEVGTNCCDYLTDSKAASNFKESKLRFESRQNRFLTSKKWTYENGIYKLIQKPFVIEILEVNNNFYLRINNKKSKIPHDSLVKAKTIVFENIQNGKIRDYFKEKNIELEVNKEKKKKNERPTKGLAILGQTE